MNERYRQYDLLLWQLVITAVAFLLFFDEIWMFFPEVGSPGWLIGDWSFLHIPGLHHWMYAPFLLVGAWIILPIFLTWRNSNA